MNLPEAVSGAIARLEAAGYEAVAVGGCVRDWRMGRVPSDYDLATDAPPEAVRAVFSGARVVPTGLRHGTVTLVTGGMAVEITTYRVDGAYRDHRRPEGVTFTRSLTEDLKRRDFTVNAMAFSPSRGLIDPMGGQWDIDQKLIRAVGDPEARFREDALRILRALRFAARLVFSIEPGTARALWDQRDSLAFVARERVGAEICRLVTGPGAAAVAEAHRPVLVSALPPLAAASDGAYREGLARLARAPAAPAPRLAALVSPIPEGAREALDSLRLPARLSERALRLAAWLTGPEPDPARALGALGPEDARALFAMRGADNARLEALIASDACVSLRQLAVNGRDLQALGLNGAAVGAALERLLDEVIAGAPNERGALLSRIRTLL